MRILRGDGPPLRVGHRGAAALAPENTLESFARAVEEGVDAIEFDVLGDAIAHDVHAGSGLSLDAALAFLAASGVGLQVDLKTRGTERDLVDALRRHDVLDRTVVSSFHADSLRTLAELEPALRRFFTYPEDKAGVAQRPLLRPAVRGALRAIRLTLPRRVAGLLARCDAAGLTLHFTLVDEAVVRACHRAGAAVWAWTANDEAEIRRLERIGTDAIITDDPRLAPGSFLEETLS